MSFVKRMLKVEIALAKGQFSGGGNTKTLVGYRMRAIIQVAGDVSSGTADLTIFGLPLETMNQLSMVGRFLSQHTGNQIKIYAGETDDDRSIKNEALAFSGLIVNAWVDANAMPAVAFKIQAVPGGGGWSVKETKPVSQKGSQSATSLLAPIAKQMGLTLETNGVNVKLQNPYYGGSPWSQAVAICRDAGVSMTVEKSVMAVTPPGKPRDGDEIIVSAKTGMIGYPMFSQAAIIVATLYRPEIKNQGKIKVESDLAAAQGAWMVIYQTLDLECLAPKGRWQQVMQAIEVKGEAPPA